MNGRHHLLACADDINLLGEKNTDVRLETNAGKTKYMFMPVIKLQAKII
jgi:hypothetical protein